MIAQKTEHLCLNNLGFGAAAEMFNTALTKVLENIQDPNTDSKKTRSVTLKINIHPNEERDCGKVMIDVNAKLAPEKPHVTQIFMGKVAGHAVATESDPKQMRLFDEPHKMSMIKGGE